MNFTGSLFGFNRISLNTSTDLSQGFPFVAAAMTFAPGITVTFKPQDVLNPSRKYTFTSFTAVGTAARPITLITSILNAKTVVDADTTDFAHLIIRDNTAGGAASPFSAGTGSVSRGNVTNWIFPDPSLRIQNVFMTAAAADGTVQTINIGVSDDGDPIFYEVLTQELEFGNRAHLKKIANEIAVFTQFGAESSLQASTDGGKLEDVDMDFNDRVSIGQSINLEGHFFIFRWFGSSSTVSPVFEGLYLESITDMGMTQS